MTKSTTRRRIIRELEYALSFDLMEILRDDGTIKTLDEMSPAARRCIQSITFSVSRRPRIIEIRLVDKNETCALLDEMAGGGGRCRR